MADWVMNNMNWDFIHGVKVDIYINAGNVVFWVLFLAWFLGDILKRRTGSSNLNRENAAVPDESILSTRIIIFCHVIVSSLNLGHGFRQFVDLRIVNFMSISWFFATVIALYCRYRTLREGSKWPMILILWWVFSCICCSVSVSIHFLIHFNFVQFHSPLPEPDIVDLISLPFSLLLCFFGVRVCFSADIRSGLEQPLLKDHKKVLKDSASFTDAGIWSQITFQWLNPLFSRGRIQQLELSHIPSVPPSETAKEASFLLEESLLKRKNETCNLPEAIAYSVWKSLIMNGVFAGFTLFVISISCILSINPVSLFIFPHLCPFLFISFSGINTIASYMGPLLITRFVDFLSEKQEGSSYLYGMNLALIFFISKTIESLTQRQWYFGAQRIGIRVRSALTVMIYKKSLSVQFAGPSNGTIINMINLDVERIGDFCWNIHRVWLLPLQVFLALVILCLNLGAAPSLAAVISTILIMVSNTPLANKQETLHSDIMEAKDSRIKSTSETLKSMRVLKLYSWESTFLKKLLQLRDVERKKLRSYLYTSSTIAFLFWASPTLVSVITFGVCILLKTPLTTGTVLSALATFRILQDPIYNLPELISMIAQTKISVYRIHEFIKEEGQRKQISYHSSKVSEVAIEIEPGQYAWETSDQNTRKPAIRITESMKIVKGYKVAVCGSVGSGKSSLLCSILGEIPRISGTGIKVYGTKAYVPQSPWIQTGTIKENILFGKDMDKAFYEAVLEGCALSQDIGTWMHGDLTVVGERGINLSGGQKQRIQLARAVYSNSDVYILDDPFSAVDAHTATHLFKKCLAQLLSQKTVIYATHQLEFLDAADLVLVMKDGMIVQSGKYEDLIADPTSELVRQMAAHKKSLNQVNPPPEDNAFTSGASKLCQIEVTEERLEVPISTSRLPATTQEEETETGRVKWSVYATFVTSAYKGALVPVILLCQVLFQGLQMGSNYWIAWASEDANKISREKLIAIFVILSGGSSIFILGRAVLLATIAVETAQSLFLGMVESVFRAPISFFDSTPSSRILNRSSMDQSTVDTDIPYRLAGLAFALIQLLSIIILMSQVAWQIFLLFLIIIGISMWYQSYYIATARELARMVGIKKAPILHHFSESIDGAATIHCFNQEDRFLARNLSLIDDYSRIVFHNSGTMEWLCVRINFLFNFVFFLVLIILVNLPESAIDTSLAGLAATYGLNLNVLQAWVIWNLCNVENKMISVERILQFTNIPSEAPLVIGDSKPNPEWPTDGTIELVNLCVQYRPDLPMVLKSISCTFPGGKKIGVVGRTGSGKSTLIQALFRVIEPSEGQILIDGLDICKIGLQDLRSRLGIIPQDPTLFQGNVRYNLDPLEEHSDHEIWEVLKNCRLADIVRQDSRLLEAPVAEDGENWSVGQRQLVCLARVLLKKRRILVLDEATASIDTATDNIIQETIREETSRCTVITVAHRIPTVIDNDLVLVLDEGKVIEYDSPEELLKDHSSSFSKLVSEFLRRSSKRNSNGDFL